MPTAKEIEEKMYQARRDVANLKALLAEKEDQLAGMKGHVERIRFNLSDEINKEANLTIEFARAKEAEKKSNAQEIAELEAELKNLKGES